MSTSEPRATSVAPMVDESRCRSTTMWVLMKTTSDVSNAMNSMLSSSTETARHSGVRGRWLSTECCCCWSGAATCFGRSNLKELSCVTLKEDSTVCTFALEKWTLLSWCRTFGFGACRLRSRIEFSVHCYTNTYFINLYLGKIQTKKASMGEDME